MNELLFEKKLEKTSYGHEIGSPEVSGAENKTPGRKARPEFKFDVHFISNIDFNMFVVFFSLMFFAFWGCSSKLLIERRVNLITH